MSEVLLDVNSQSTDDRGSNEGPSARPAPGRGPRVASAKKLEANRRNAQRSTGPRTQEGKEKSRWNAVKHSLLIKAIGGNIRGTGESRAEFQRLLMSLSDELQPVGILEHSCVERMAVAYWRLHRVIRAEAIELRAEAIKLRRSYERAEDRAQDQDVQDEEMLALYNQIEKEVDETNDISDETFEKLHRADGLFPSGVFWTVTGLRPVAADPDATKRQVARVREALKEQKAEIERKRLTAAADVKPRHDSGAYPLFEGVPHVIASRSRYEIMFSRELDRAMDRLTKLQRARKKEEARQPPAPDFTKQTHRAG